MKVNFYLMTSLFTLTITRPIKTIAIAEDATRVIARAQYDNETDRIVGFVLPCDSLPVVDSFIATSFSAIENNVQRK